MLAADSGSSIEDVVFEHRFACAEGFAAFGGRVRTEGRTLQILPSAGLKGAEAAAPDLRGGAALVIAALAAQGKSRVTNTALIDRGYAGFAPMLAELGSEIRRETRPPDGAEKKRPAKNQI